jgi:hypothetical protein
MKKGILYLILDVSKIYTSFFLLFILSQSVNAQSDFHFADSTAQWNVLINYTCLCYQLETDVYNVTKDTMISGKSYQEISSQSQVFFVRRDSIGRVYNRTEGDTSDYLIYDFSKVAGDTFSISTRETSTPMATVHVDSVDSVNLFVKRKVMYISGYYPSDIWIEGIGSIYSSFSNPAFSYQVIDADLVRLLCYFQRDTLLYHDTTYSSCVIDTTRTGINNIANNSLKIFPNPVTDNFVNIQLSGTPFLPLFFRLYDITGRMILQKELTGETTPVELDDISKGMYLYSISSSKAETNTGKLVVE